MDEQPMPGDEWMPGRGISDEWVHDGPYGHLHLRDFFAAFALMAVVSLDLEDATHGSDAAYAYSAADAMMEERRRRIVSETDTESGGNS